MNNDKDNEPSTIEDLNTVNVEQSTSNVVQSRINVEQNIGEVNDSSNKDNDMQCSDLTEILVKSAHSYSSYLS